ncbi:endonuclease III [Halorhodospira abdelmalekii]|uniref:endonuclease III n=1 Tax=Halorhodospira abdelmalekii TaxID=421629 RepID=UPI0019090347|nr:endonuclease III [Halorhodospira abdelmalekii]MBK1735032.1 endonuclease III [Halorhodospira abdelmalekii]
MEPDRCYEFYRRLCAALPEPRTELNYRSPFELLVAVILSAQSTDRSVNAATAALFAVAATPARMVALGEAGLKSYIRTIGLYNSKARHIVAASQLLLERHDGAVPRTRAELEALPGVGRKTANVILNTAFGEPTIAVDTHVFRVANRSGLAPGRDVLTVETQLEAVTPEPFRLHAHHWLILHGRYTCTARKPRCADCIVADLCDWARAERSGHVDAGREAGSAPSAAGSGAKNTAQHTAQHTGDAGEHGGT